ncbi:MAG: DUF1573 domain-containing protein [Bacteroidia bacterium]
MKKLIVSTLLIFAGLGTALAQTPATNDENAAEIKFEKETHDFGTIPQGTPVTYEFKFTNKGKSPLILTNASASCGCTTPDWSKEPIKPGKTGYVKATYNAASPGEFTKSVTVQSNAKNSTVILYLKGNVKPAESN